MKLAVLGRSGFAYFMFCSSRECLGIICHLFILLPVALSRSGITLRMLLDWAVSEIRSHKQVVDDLSE